MAPILGLSNELLHNIFVHLDPPALDSLSATCQSLHNYVQNNRLLWRQLYICRYDDPVVGNQQHEPAYATELRKFERFLKLLAAECFDTKHQEMPFIVKTTQSLLSTASSESKESLNIALLIEKFQGAWNKQALLHCSTIYHEATGTEKGEYEPTSAALRQWCAKSHCLYGTSDEPPDSSFLSPPFHYARSIVYDLRGYTEHNLWGPFLNEPDASESDGLRVDWEKMEAIMLVLNSNLQHFSEHHGVEIVWDKPFAGVTGCRMPAEKWKGEVTPRMPMIKQPDPCIDAMDPYGITGTWRRVVCFLDYNDFYLFNFHEQTEERTPIATDEAVRLITLKLFATRIEAPGEFDNPTLPVVHFRGSSQSMHPSWDPNANSAIRGTVRLTPEGEIRWTTLSIFHGFSEPRWKSEGIQIGGLRSKRGVIGTWFDKDYDRQGPCGPTAFWKLGDEIEEEKELRRVPHFDYMSL